MTSLTLRMIELINSHGISCSTLTKGVMPVDLADSIRFPGRIRTVSAWCRSARSSEKSGSRELHRTMNVSAHYANCMILAAAPLCISNLTHTEHYEQDLRELLDAVDFADEIWFGSWNYNNLAKQYPGFQGIL